MKSLWRALLIYSGAAVLTTWPLAWHPTTLLGAPVGPGDPFLNLWALGWGLHTVVTEPFAILTGAVFNANIFHPATGTLAYSDHLLLQSVALSPLYALTGDVVLCYNVLLLLSLALSALAMHAYVRTAVGVESAAYLAGLAWGFGSYRFGHLLHLQLQSLYWLPLAALVLHRVVAGRRRRDAVVLGGLSLGLTATRRGRGRLLGRLALAAVVAGGVALPVGVVYLRVQQEQGFGRNLFEAAQGEARVSSYLQVPAGNLLYGRTGLLHAPSTSADARGAGPERELFPGFVLLGLAVLGVRAGWRSDTRPLVVAMCVVTVTGLVLSLGPDGVRPLYAFLHRFVFGFQAIRAPARFAVLVMFGLSVLGAVGWRELSRHAHGLGRLLPAPLAAVLFVLAAAEWAHVPTVLAAAPARRTAVGEWLRTAPGTGAVVVLPVGLDSESTPAMVQSLEHRRGLINGYSGQRPEFYAALVDVLSTVPSDESLLTLHDRGVQYVVTAEALPASPDSPLHLRATLDGASVYELVWTPEIEARLAARDGVLPPEPGPIPFKEGDRSEYSVRWEGGVGLEAGRIVVSVEPSRYRFVVGATTAPWVSRFFEADDRFTTVTDARLFPLTHERDQNEGARHVTRGFVYDARAGVVRSGASIDDARMPQAPALPLDGGARDAIAALFFSRTLPLSPGARYQIPINEAGRNLRLDLTVTGVETITVQGQSRQAWRLAPTIRQRVERRRTPAASLWLSDDARRLPLALEVNAAFGRVRMELVSHQDGR
ncbi:MAG: DUF3108 domain-containing protein [Vicinamibacterales bacterium]